jgi:ERCC4-type nuclease
MLIAPTEPLALRKLGKVSSLPEKYGADVLMTGVAGTYGIQRKEVTDLVASVYDGRLAKEMAQWKSLNQSVLLVEGQLPWSNDGVLLSTRQTFTKAQYLGLTFSVQSAGSWMLYTSSLTDTSDAVSALQTWVMKEHHSGLARPKPAKNEWGRVDSRDWCIHVLQSWESIGKESAAAIYDKFGLPLQWTVTETDLLTIPGIGKKRAGMMIESLSGGRMTFPDEFEIEVEDDQ